MSTKLYLLFTVVKDNKKNVQISTEGCKHLEIFYLDLYKPLWWASDVLKRLHQTLREMNGISATRPEKIPFCFTSRPGNSLGGI